MPTAFTDITTAAFDIEGKTGRVVKPLIFASGTEAKSVANVKVKKPQ